ncbi:hypothetical protein PAAG_11670 [Paracoccidioides lutzii Pb01]|uniref:Aminoglycoside phosphotransferase domain-containing protein n=1 Tax=Paracoccidioides lutzii (strain ATCC MYA-826 / Pb01) TaxID=502779 RepID=A0A0A2VKZ7_PARBA|nr:hypothetical protein PAAG_11670 [Paracoccidioides lutzii Pb01]KGQ01549.1 hypothetical protein PAAG_11670 [Paracoccidioides lutzii Pb01]
MSDDLHDMLSDEPDVNLLPAFPKNYTHRITMVIGAKIVPCAEEDAPEKGVPPEFSTRLDLAETTRVIFPLSLLARHDVDQALPNLSHEKLLIQHQLEDIFYRLRAHQQNNGIMLGGVSGERAKEIHVNKCTLLKGITTALEFNYLQFSCCNHTSTTHIKLLRSFLEHGNYISMNKLLFALSDVRTDNIMVKQDSVNNHYVATGIIDWDDGGFYPAYYECTVLTRTLSVVDEDGW